MGGAVWVEAQMSGAPCSVAPMDAGEAAWSGDSMHDTADGASQA